MMKHPARYICCTLGLLLPLAQPVVAQFVDAASARVLTVNHYVPTVSAVPAIEGEIAQLYVRERAQPEPLFAASTLRAGSSCSYTVPERPPRWHSTYRIPATVGWKHIASAGFDVFSMDTTGLRPVDAAIADERSVQSVRKPAG